VTLHDLVLVTSELVRLAEDLVGDVDLANIVDVRGAADLFDDFHGKTHRERNAIGVASHSARVSHGVEVLGLEVAVELFEDGLLLRARTARGPAGTPGGVEPQEAHALLQTSFGPDEADVIPQHEVGERDAARGVEEGPDARGHPAGDGGCYDAQEHGREVQRAVGNPVGKPQGKSGRRAGHESRRRQGGWPATLERALSVCGAPCRDFPFVARTGRWKSR